jgi:hypothetical protein
MTILHGVTLELALAASVADGAIERMVNEEELHHAALAFLRDGGLGVDAEPGGDGCLAADDGLGGRLGGGIRIAGVGEVNLDKAKAAVAGDAKGGVPAIVGDVDVFPGRDGDDSLPLVAGHFAVVEEETNDVGAGLEGGMDGLISHVACLLRT